MKITEKHKNGASITVSGWGARRYTDQWRKLQDSGVEEKEEEAPKVTGTGSSTQLNVSDWEANKGNRFARNPIIFGFTRNEDNA